VDVTTANSGATVFTITLSDPKLYEGDEVQLWVDEDLNANTGSGGFEHELIATGHSSSGPTFTLCEFGSITACADWAQFAQDRQLNSGSHAIDFGLTFGVAAFRFFARTIYKQPGNTTTLYDYAPGSASYAGTWTFQTKADPDNDGLYGTSDKCPTVAARGKVFDRNHNGCPGTFPLIKEQLHSATTGPKPGLLQVQKLWVTGVPAGSTVVISSPRGVERLRASSSGKASSRRVCCGARGPQFRWGSRITIRITKRGFVGVLERNVVRKRGLVTAGRLCIPATGGAAVRCSAKLRGS
jgi:hypothetical protein